MVSDRELQPGSVWWVDFGEPGGRVQQGQRPAVVVSSMAAVHIVQRLVAVLPCTTTDRGWPNHVQLSGNLQLPRATFAMTEQLTTIDRDTLLRPVGQLNTRCRDEIRMWINDWLM